MNRPTRSLRLTQGCGEALHSLLAPMTPPRDHCGRPKQRKKGLAPSGDRTG
jgi:hypothetical protein